MDIELSLGGKQCSRWAGGHFLWRPLSLTRDKMNGESVLVLF